MHLILQTPRSQNSGEEVSDDRTAMEFSPKVEMEVVMTDQNPQLFCGAVSGLDVRITCLWHGNILADQGLK